MKKKILKNTGFLVVLSILLTFLFVVAVMYHQLEQSKEQELKSSAAYLKELLEEEPIEELDEQLKSFSCRVTVIDTDGMVLYDSEQSEASMENHLERPEVQEALSYGSGKAVRYSQTLSKQSFYYACQLEDGTILRGASTMDSIFSLMYSCTAVLCLSVLVISVTAVYLINWQTNKMIAPINELDLEHPLEAMTYEELSPLLRRIQQQNEQIALQMDTLQKQQEEYLAITENMKDGLIVTSRYVVLSINKAAQTLFHTTAEECIGKDIIVVNRNQALKETLSETLEGHQVQKKMEMDQRTYQVMGNPVYADERISGAVIFIFDITEKQKTEIIRQEFSANVSHELKTPLMSISGYAEIMKNGMVKPEHVTEFSTRIFEEARRLTTLVEDIIRLSKLDDDNFQMEMEEIDIVALSREICKTLEHSAKQQQVRLEVLGNSGMIQGMKQIIYEMLYNLCDNAVKYNTVGGLVQVIITDTADGVCWEVKDTGIGIAPEDQERIFERFYRVDKSHSRATGGTGLGLSIVKHGAALHNAEIELESQPGEGTTVRIYFK